MLLCPHQFGMFKYYWLINTFTILQCPPQSILILWGFRVYLSDDDAFLGLYLAFFIFNISVSLYFRCTSCKTNTGFCMFIQVEHFYLKSLIQLNFCNFYEIWISNARFLCFPIFFLCLLIFFSLIPLIVCVCVWNLCIILLQQLLRIFSHYFLWILVCWMKQKFQPA